LVNYWDKYTEMHGQQNIKKMNICLVFFTYAFCSFHHCIHWFISTDEVTDYHYCLSGCPAMPYGSQVLTVWKNTLFLSSAFPSKLKMETACYPPNISNSIPNCMSPQPARCRLTIRYHKDLTFLKKFSLSPIWPQPFHVKILSPVFNLIPAETSHSASYIPSNSVNKLRIFQNPTTFTKRTD